MEEDNKLITIGVRGGSYILTPEQMAAPLGDFLKNKATKRKTLLWLDDQRNPFLNEEGKVPKVAIEEGYEIVWVLNYSQFTKYIKENGIPDMVSFDHDLGKEFEIWKDIKDYEGIYQVSTLGRVIRIKKSKGTSGGNMLIPNKREGGLNVLLRNGGNDKKFRVHRLVGEAFLSNPENKPEINHLDGNRWNNNVNNLEWATPSENILHAHNELTREYTAYGENHGNSLTVSQYDKNGILINVYGSVHEAGRQLGISFSNIAKCARNERKSAGGFAWKYENKHPTVNSNIAHICKEDKNYSNRFFIPDTFKEKTGLDCARWLVERCKSADRGLPIIYIHSANPVGKMFIENFLHSEMDKLNYDEAWQ